MGGGLESRCVGRVCGADVAAYGFLHRVFGWVVVLRAAAQVVCAVRMLQHMVFYTEFLDGWWS